MPKVHFVKHGTFGLFEHRQTACFATGEIEGNDLIHYLTGAKYRLGPYGDYYDRKDKRPLVTCVTCLLNY